MRALTNYLIRLNSNPNLVLAEAGGSVALAWRDPTDLRQLWEVRFTDSTNRTFHLINIGRNQGISCLGYGDHLQFLNSTGDAWEFTADGISGQWTGIRLVTNSDWNLNALGNPPFDSGRRVGVFRWTGGNLLTAPGGAANELWSLADAAQTPNPRGTWVIVHSGYGADRHLMVRLDDNSGTQTLMIGATTQGDHVLFEKTDWGQGFSLRNRFNQKFIRWGGADRPLQQAAAMSLDCLWTTTPLSVAPFSVIRPFRDSGQNFDVFQNPADPVGAPVYSWRWHGPATNVAWLFVDPPPFG